MPDLDFVPVQRTATAAAPFAARADVTAAPATAPFAPRADTTAAPTARPLALTRFDAPTAVDPQAQAAGWAAGYAAGARQAAADAERQAAELAVQHEQAEQVRAAEHARAVAALARAAQDLQARTAPVLADAARALQDAALELAVTLLGAELSDASASARAALARVLGAEGLPDGITVRLHPRDAAALPADVPVPVVADPTLSPGDAVAEHTDGHLDARLTAAVERVRAALEAS